MDFQTWAKKQKRLIRIEENIRDGAFLLAFVLFNLYITM